MAFRHGRFASATINGTSLQPYLDNAGLSVDIDTAETSTFGNLWKTNIAGMAGAQLEISGNYDPVVTVGPQAVLQPLIGADPFPCLFFPGGNSSGQRQQAFNAILTAYSESSTIGDKVTFSATLLVTGPVTGTQVP